VAVVANPQVIAAIDPRYGLALLAADPTRAGAVVAAVFLVVTGGEALYADLGQFGRAAIRRAWYGVVLPGLLLSYFGQGALVLSAPATVDNPFFRLAPSSLQLPLVLLAAIATVIASQAVITGVFSLSRQAIELGFLVPMRFTHTSSANEHHVYVGAVNSLLAAATILAVLSFRSSAALAEAYGLSVAGAMVTTTVLAVTEMRRRYRTRRLVVLAAGSTILALDLVFFGSSAGKFAHGGWFPALIAAAVTLVMVSWHFGRARLIAMHAREGVSLGRLAVDLPKHKATLSAPIIALIRPGARSAVTLDRI